MRTGIFADRHEPLFLNEGTFHSELVLQKMEALQSVVAPEDSERLARDIALLKGGIAGEKRVAFELKNAHYPLVFLHDLNLEHDGTTAQIDFLVISPFNVFVLECKNLVGDIEIQSDGTFVRTFGTGYRRRREVIYSPVTQNTRHVELMKAIIRSENGKIIGRLLGGMLDSYFHSVVVLANDKTMLSATNAPKDVRAQVVRGDQLINHVKMIDQASARKSERDSFKQMKRNAQGWLKRSKPIKVDLTDKYTIVGALSEVSDSVSEQPVEPPVQTVPQQASQFTEADIPVPVPVPRNTTPICPVCGSSMQLRTARYGAHKGEKFWGCSTYWATRCPGIVPVDKSG